MFSVERLDHLVLTVRDTVVTCEFYTRVLGMATQTFGEGRTALVFGEQKINLHAHGHEFEPKAAHAIPGSADLCLLTSTPMNEVIEHLHACGVPLVEGPVARTGARFPLLSVYIRDPDRNLIEIANETANAAS